MDTNIKEDKFIAEFSEIDLFLAELLDPSKSSRIEHSSLGPQRNALKDTLLYKKGNNKGAPHRPRRRTNPFSETTIEVGTTIAGRYEVGRFIAKGGFGEVYQGHHKKLGIAIAIKVIKSDKVADEIIKDRFIREAKIMATINHPNVVRIYDVGEFDDRIYLVMDFIDGMDLDAFIEKKKQPLAFDYLNLMTQIVDALAAIHKQGIIHRDIKPSNVMIDKSGRATLMDFGLAKDRPSEFAEEEKLTVEGMFLGTPLYMAPEQFRTPNHATKESDVYSLGVLLYQMLTGLNPFTGRTYPEVYDNHKCITPQPVHILSNRIPPKVGRIVDKMLQKNPSKRYSDGDAVKEALRRAESKKIPGFLKIAAIVAIIGLFSISFFLFTRQNSISHPPPTGGSQPRIYSVLPFGAGEKDHPYFSDAITSFLSESGYDIVERENIEKIIEELNFSESKWSDKQTAVSIGREVGAHIIITGNISSYKGKDQVHVRAFNVETSEILGAAKIDPNDLKSAIIKLVDNINNRLVYQSTISTVDGKNIKLKHGQLRGAAVGMKLRVINDNDEPIGALEISQMDRESAVARILTSEDELEVGMKVEEVKD